MPRTRSTRRCRTWAAAPAVTAVLLALTAGCGAGGDGPVRHPTADPRITATVGERFTLTFDDNASTRVHWYLTTPRPDKAVVREVGNTVEGPEKPEPGAGGRRTFTFEATGAGRTTIVLLHCVAGACDGASPASPTPGAPSANAPAPTRVSYTVTVHGS